MPRPRGGSSPASGAILGGSVFLLAAALGCDSSTAPPPATSGAGIVTDFEGASLAGWSETRAGRFALWIRKDTNSEFARWYSFRVRGGAGEFLTFQIENAGDVSVPEA